MIDWWWERHWCLSIYLLPLSFISSSCLWLKWLRRVLCRVDWRWMTVLDHSFEKILRKFASQIFISFLVRFLWLRHSLVMTILRSLEKLKSCILRVIEVNRLLSSVLCWSNRLVLDSNCLWLFQTWILFWFSLLTTSGSLMNWSLMICFWTKVMTFASIWLWSLRRCWLFCVSSSRLRWFVISRANIDLLHIHAICRFLMNKFNSRRVHRWWNDWILILIFWPT